MAEVERLNEEIRTLVRERQDLRTRGAAREELEQNRQQIVSRQWRLAHAFGEVYSPRRAPRAA
jgi:FtsZ-binding cell division protein ZapB